MSDPNQITRQQLADLIGAKSPSYINELAKTGRAFKAPDGKHWLKAESLAAWNASRNPAFQGVADRHAAARAGHGAATAPEPAADDEDDRPTAASSTTAQAGSARDAQIGSSYQQARAVKEKFFALEAKRAYEVAIGTLRDAREVEGLVATAMVEIRQRLENLATSIAPVVAAQADEAAVRATLRDAFDHTLQSASHHFDQLRKTSPA
jgi:hypothetical protein